MKNVFDSTVAILIPVYQAVIALETLVQSLRTQFANILIVDDGSTVGCEVLSRISQSGITIIHHSKNQGKGEALKTGFKYLRTNFADLKVVVTADADGQHSFEDICRVAQAALDYPNGLTLGVRTFLHSSNKNSSTHSIPLRSRFGNFWSYIFFRLLVGYSVVDTQTGLRAIPVQFLENVEKLSGGRYEYEIQMLIQARHHPQKPQCIPISTIYLDGNKTSHFHPLRDTFLTQFPLWKCLWERITDWFKK